MLFALKVEDWDPRTRAAAARAEGVEAAAPAAAATAAVAAAPLPLAPRQPLTDDDRAAARTAWAYFAANTIADTGLVGSVQGFDGASLWDLGSQLYAIASAEITGVLPRAEAVSRSRAA